MRGAEATLISESGLYKLIMRSDKPQAKAFQDWVTKEVLPSIRKTGSFVTGQPSLVENPQMSALEVMMSQAKAVKVASFVSRCALGGIGTAPQEIGTA